MTDEGARNDFLKTSVCREAALAIVNDVNWKIALRNCTIEGTKVTTPLRKLIKKLPGLFFSFFHVFSMFDCREYLHDDGFIYLFA